MVNVIAHRGARRLAPENTVQAFRTAIRVGAAGIELDARRSLDGVIVVHHDARLADGCPIVELPAADLPAHIPTLDAALDACAGAFVNIEIKNDPSEPDFDPADGVASDVIALLGRRDETPGSWLISSFRLETADCCRRLDPDVPTAWLAVAPVSADDIGNLAAAGHRAIHPWVPTVDEALIRACHEAGLQVNAWTCNDVERARELAGWGIDGICTDVPDVMVKALGQETPTSPPRARGGTRGG